MLSSLVIIVLVVLLAFESFLLWKFFKEKNDLPLHTPNRLPNNDEHNATAGYVDVIDRSFLLKLLDGTDFEVRSRVELFTKMVKDTSNFGYADKGCEYVAHAICGVYEEITDGSFNNELFFVMARHSRHSNEHVELVNKNLKGMIFYANSIFYADVSPYDESGLHAHRLLEMSDAIGLDPRVIVNFNETMRFWYSRKSK